MNLAFEHGTTPVHSANEPVATLQREGVDTLIRCVHLQMSGAIDTALAQDPLAALYGLNSAQLSVLSALEGAKAFRATQLCKAFACDRGVMSRMLDRLESVKLLRRARRNGERRTITLELTAEGRSVVLETRGCVLGIVTHFLADIPASELRQLQSVLHRILMTRRETNLIQEHSKSLAPTG